MPRFNLSEIHERRHHVFVSRHELDAIVTEAVCKEIGVNPKRDGVEVKIRFEDATEGSPAYRVGTQVTVEVVEDMSPQAVATS